MSKKNDTAAALAGILNAKRGGPGTPAPALTIAMPDKPETLPPPSPALPSAPQPLKGRGGKSSDPTYTQCSIYLRKITRKTVGRALDDVETGQDLSELVEELLQQWLASRT